MSVLEKHFTKIAAGLTAVFALIRYFAFQQMAGSVVLKLPVLDSETYYLWGFSLATGHGHPTGPFWLSPGYSMFIGWLFRLTGDHTPGIIVIAQMLLSCATFLLLILLTRKMFGTLAAVLAGVIGIIYAPWLYFDGVILSATWILFLNTVMLYLIMVPGGMSDGKPQRVWAWAIAGAACSLSIIARPSMLPFAFLLLFYLLWLVRNNLASRKIPIAFAVALVLVHLPISARNLKEGGSPFFVTTSGGVNFFIGNRQGATGIYDEMDFVKSFDAPTEAEGYRLEASKRAGRVLTLPEAASWWQSQAVQDIKEHPLGWSGLLLKKLWWTLRNEEVASNFSFRAMQMVNKWVNHLPLRWGLLFPLAAAAVILWWSSRKKLIVFGLYTAGYILTILVLYPMSEYRFPLIAVCIPLAAAALVGIVEGFKQKQTTRVTWALALYMMLMLPANAPSKEAATAVYPRVDFANLGSVALREQMYPEALAMFSRALSIDGENQEARIGMADALWHTKNFDQAREEYQRAGMRAPDEISGSPLDTLQTKLLELSLSEGDSAALAYLDKEIPNPESMNVRELWVTRARLQEKLGDYFSASRSMLQAHELDPENPEWLYWAGKYALALNYPRTADSLWEEAVKIYPAYAPARVELGFLAYSWGHFEDAVIQSRELDKIQIHDDSTRTRAHELDSLLRHLNW
jgi:Flp pilus assembly protein TadD